MTDIIITEARDAWARICRRGQTSFGDWIAVGKAVAIGRGECLLKAGTNKPYGKVYTRLMSSWLAANGLDEINQQERWWSLQVIDNLDAISVWRQTLDDAQRRRFNHPQAVWSNWRKSCGLPTQRKAKAGQRRSGGVADSATPDRKSETAKQDSYLTIPVNRIGRPIFFDQEMVRRGATAMRESRSADWFILARLCLEAAIRNSDDALGLLNTARGRPTASAALAPALA